MRAVATLATSIVAFAREIIAWVFFLFASRAFASTSRARRRDDGDGKEKMLSCFARRPRRRRDGVGSDLKAWAMTEEEAMRRDPLGKEHRKGGHGVENGGRATPRSRESVRAVRVKFENCCEYPVKLIWIGYDGRARAYGTIQPGTCREQSTFDSHPWSFVGKKIGPRPSTLVRCVVEDSPLWIGTIEEEDEYDDWEETALRKRTLKICEPKVSNDWSLATHAQTCDAFKRATRAMLLCHHRSAAREEGLGALPRDLLIHEVIARAAPYEAKYVMPEDKR